MPLLTAANVKNSHMLTGKHFIFLEKCPRLNLKVFQYQIWTLLKRSYQVTQICSKFGLQLC